MALRRHRQRNKLHKNDLDALLQWAKSQGFNTEPCKGFYEVARLRLKCR
jgi:hypothetical protein